jgi:hypothetical protein
MREHGSGGGDALGGDGGHQLADARTHHAPDFLSRNREVNDGGRLGPGLRNLRWFDHGGVL